MPFLLGRLNSPSIWPAFSMADSQRLTVYKITLLGDPGVGKTTFLSRHRTGEYLRDHIPTMGVEVHPLTFYTAGGPTVLKLWEVAGNSPPDQVVTYLTQADAVIVMVDLTRQTRLDYWVELARQRLSKNIPIIVVGNKADVGKSSLSYYRQVRAFGLVYYEVSARSNYNFEKPFLAVLQHYLGSNTQLIEAPAMAPPEAPLDTTLLNAIADENEESDSVLGIPASPPLSTLLSHMRGIANTLLVPPAKL